MSHFLVNLSTTNIDKVVSMLFSQHQWTWVDTTFLFSLILTLKQHWVINNESTYLYHPCFNVVNVVNVEITSVNIRRLNFHFPPNFNVETTLVHRRWIDVILSTLFQRCFVNVETTSIIVRRLKQCWWTLTINVDSTLMCLLDYLLTFLRWTKTRCFRALYQIHFKQAFGQFQKIRKRNQRKVHSIYILVLTFHGWFRVRCIGKSLQTLQDFECIKTYSGIFRHKWAYSGMFLVFS